MYLGYPRVPVCLNKNWTKAQQESEFRVPTGTRVFKRGIVSLGSSYFPRVPTGTRVFKPTKLCAKLLKSTRVPTGTRVFKLWTT